ncbi:RagB/SusD family nutrient uptake outer membrane protein [Pedobacter sp.]|jgi:tetratricopeptide (TPR) repeat protein|uniref:RagB/SusD family nutrient uptake outer membrane protein n=1 Tax=Pedobacter sp. TaxID=1411316 RepID=UPI002BE09F6F|nr:RagB/SusD family nutrient uptake outer membrane protein [Pedobacter sp.]HWW41210.1 RagB/SusD family nutrient uptake outer membrane protein [Pedobacter sp.]
MKPFVYISFLSMLLMIASCSLNKTPYDSLTPDGLNNSPGSLRSATDGNYARLKTMALGWYRIQEFPGDNVSLSGVTTSHLIYLYNYQRIPTNSFANSFWQNSYQVIVAANKIIETVPAGQSVTNDQLLGENYYLRALLHFSLCNIFGRPYSQGTQNLGVPVKIDADPNNHPIRSSVGDVYKQVVADLNKSISLMNTYKGSVYASKEAAWALLSRIYLYMEDNQKAIEYADKVISSGRYSLLPTADLANYPVFKPEDNKETIFAVKFIPDQDLADNGWSNIGSIYSTISGVGYGEMYASQSFLELVQRYPQDVRNKFISPLYLNNGKEWAIYSNSASQYVKVPLLKENGLYYYTNQNNQKQAVEKENGVSGLPVYSIRLADNSKKAVRVEPEIDMRNGYPKYFIIKCSRQEGQPQLWSPIISRLAEMYLNRAEANVKLGFNDAALTDLNLIRKRAGIPDQGLYTLQNLPSGQSLLDVVLDERRLELAWEGHRKFDIFRNKRNLDHNFPGVHLTGNGAIRDVSWQSNAIVEYIPESQILVHKGLQQNP